MNATPLKIALVGAGLIGRAYLARLDAPRDGVCAICDPSEAGRALAAERALPWFPSPDAMLAEMTPTEP